MSTSARSKFAVRASTDEKDGLEVSVDTPRLRSIRPEHKWGQTFCAAIASSDRVLCVEAISFLRKGANRSSERTVVCRHSTSSASDRFLEAFHTDYTLKPTLALALTRYGVAAYTQETFISDTKEWKALKEHVNDIEKTHLRVIASYLPTYLRVPVQTHPSLCQNTIPSAAYFHLQATPLVKSAGLRR
eukprot:1176100-Prorocentrum_minimum.AAC.2